MKTNKKVIRTGAILILLVMSVFVASTFSMAATTIEDLYSVSKSTPVSDQIIQIDGVDTYVIYYPTTLQGTNGYPVVVWGNGTYGQPENFDSLFRHLASWGFIVIDNYCPNTVTGQEIMDTALYIVSENRNPDSVFYQKINVDKVGAAGVSQGAHGILNASYRYPQSPLIKTLCAISTPADKWCAEEVNIPDMSQINVPVFYTRGSGWQDAIIVPLANLQARFNAMPEGTPAVMGTCKNSDHGEIKNTNGGKLGGYLTAWLCYQLKDDMTAASAFKGSNPEIVTNTERWANVAVKNMP